MCSIDLEPVIKKTEKRQLNDITDQLWMLLKCNAFKFFQKYRNVIIFMFQYVTHIMI